MDPYLYALISTFVPEHFSVLTELAGGLLIKEIRDGNTYANGVLHSFNDEPAENNSNGMKIWFKNGELHRDNDLPTVIWPGKIKMWYQNGKIHRDNGPAMIWQNGFSEWWQNGERCKIELNNFTYK